MQNKADGTSDPVMEKKMTLLTSKVTLSAIGILATVTGLALAQQYTGQVNRSAASSVLGAVDSGEELPQYEIAGFPISPHQISVLFGPDRSRHASLSSGVDRRREQLHA